MTKTEELKMKLRRFGMATAPEWNKDDLGGRLRAIEQTLPTETMVTDDAGMDYYLSDVLLDAAYVVDTAHEDWLHTQNQRLMATLDIFKPIVI